MGVPSPGVALRYPGAFRICQTLALVPKEFTIVHSPPLAPVIPELKSWSTTVTGVVTANVALSPRQIEGEAEGLMSGAAGVCRTLSMDVL
jgi:hypothetical protein